MTSLIGGRTCRSCEYSRRLDPSPKGPLHCMRYPPQVFALAVPTPQGSSVQVNSTYPTVNPDLPCGEYRRSEVRAMDELAQVGGTQ